MCSSYLNHSLIESTSLSIILEFFLFHIVRVFSIYQSLVQSQLGLFDHVKAQAVEKKTRGIELPNKLPSSREKIDNGNLSREDAEMVMEKLGMPCDPEGVKLQERWGSTDISNLFEEEISLDEVKEAFDVFDENRDGFIDAGELKRVLCTLGFKEGLEIENCRRLIANFDEDRDGRIDFNEFTKLMENSSY